VLLLNRKKSITEKNVNHRTLTNTINEQAIYFKTIRLMLEKENVGCQPCLNETRVLTPLNEDLPVTNTIPE
jgi:hypothetical protein